ncbi:MAG: M23 family metallopeptidase [Spirochaetales bacterium]|nr:M23 family metallopeptidase [Spirochaetales bacterium]
MEKEKLIGRIVEYGLHQLQHHVSFTSPVVPCRLEDRHSGEYFVVVSRPQDHSLFIQEVIEEDNGVNIVFRTWSLALRNRWEVVSVERMGERIFLEDLGAELLDFDRILDHLIKMTSPKGYYFNDELADSVLFLSLKVKRFSLRTLIDNYRVRILSALSLAAGILLLVTLSVYSAYRFRGIVTVRNEIDQKIADIKVESDERFDAVDTFMSSADFDLRSLKENLLQNERDFEFNKRQASINVLRLAEELTYYLPARKESYHLIADNISEAASYGEIIYEMSRLPSEEYQARIFLATAREKIIPFSRFQPVFASMDYPVELPGKPNDGQGFRITSTFLEKRQNPFGTGGTSPHFAIDIINVANISVINYAGEIKRDGNSPGSVVSVAPGFVTYNGWDDRYGWGIEIEHDMTPEVLAQYPDAKSWRSFYSHMALKSELITGQRVERRRFLGYIGNTGVSTGPHLHFEVRVYRPKGRYSSSAGRYDKINPYPKERPSRPAVPVN